MTYPCVNLGELCEISIGSTPARKVREFWGRGYPWLSIADMNQGRNIETTKEQITDSAIKQSRCHIVKKGTVLFSFKLSIGKVGIAKKDLYTNEAIAALSIIDKQQLCEEYLYYALGRINIASIHTDRAVMGATLNKRKLAELKIPLAPLPEQKRIAAILDKADAIRRKRKGSIALADTFLKSVFIDMFGDPVKNEKGWAVCSLEEIGTVTGGITLNSKRKSYPIKIPYLRVANVHRNILDLNEIKIINVKGNEIEKIVLVEGDILIVEGHGNKDEIGRCAVWDGSIKQCGHQNHLIKCRLNNKLAIPEFVSRFLNSEYGRRQLLKAGKTTSGLNTINITQVKGCHVPLPPVELQDKYARIVKATKKTTRIISHESGDVETLFNSLLHRAFRGEV